MPKDQIVRERSHGANSRVRTRPCVAAVLYGSLLRSRLGTFWAPHASDRSNPCNHGRRRDPTRPLDDPQGAEGVVQALCVSDPAGTGGHDIVPFYEGPKGVNNRVLGVNTCMPCT